MVNKKGFIRTLEAVLAVMLLLTMIYITAPSQELDISKPNTIKQAHSAIFAEISTNYDFRNCLLNEIDIPSPQKGALNNAKGQYSGSIVPHICIQDINSFIAPYTPHGYVYLAEVCAQSKSCLDKNLPAEKSIFAESIMLASDNPKVFRVYFWEE